MGLTRGLFLKIRLPLPLHCQVNTQYQSIFYKLLENYICPKQYCIDKFCRLKTTCRSPSHQPTLESGHTCDDKEHNLMPPRILNTWQHVSSKINIIYNTFIRLLVIHALSRCCLPNMLKQLGPLNYKVFWQLHLCTMVGISCNCFQLV